MLPVAQKIEELLLEQKAYIDNGGDRSTGGNVPGGDITTELLHRAAQYVSTHWPRGTMNISILT